jgi:hypothetical protein
MNGANQLRHEHELQFMRCFNGLSEWACTICRECYYQYEECD